MVLLQNEHFILQSYEDFIEMHKKRNRRVRAICDRNRMRLTKRNTDSSKFANIYVDDRHGLMYCMVPKVACTNWKRILIVLSGKVNTTNPEDLPPAYVHNKDELGVYLRTLKSYTPSQIRYRLKHYFKFMFVREPLERLLSAFMNKFVLTKSDYFRKRFGKKIIKNFRKDPSTESLRTGSNVTFTEFVQYLLDIEESEENVKLNNHWDFFYKLCHPCLVNYDVIGKYETMDDDVDYVLKRAKVDHIVKFPKANRYSNAPRTADILEKYFSKLSSREVHALWKMYSVDYTMFGYPYPDFS